ncbi:hypothetical protein Tsubulata_006828 [Turnera subulata]|uniref:Endonuclease/exonuclease/phosphatase domain-containing protein n=1 Tax=Turnera subulata TaxID=218843 RepID=A0A9Q0FBV8_9ROSI|nr:hypothetical protein Tsubulata_006828 [Turnera subulata]
MAQKKQGKKDDAVGEWMVVGKRSRKPYRRPDNQPPTASTPTKMTSGSRYGPLEIEPSPSPMDVGPLEPPQVTQVGHTSLPRSKPKSSPASCSPKQLSTNRKAQAHKPSSTQSKPYTKRPPLKDISNNPTNLKSNPINPVTTTANPLHPVPTSLPASVNTPTASASTSPAQPKIILQRNSQTPPKLSHSAIVLEEACHKIIFPKSFQGDKNSLLPTVTPPTSITSSNPSPLPVAHTKPPDPGEHLVPGAPQALDFSAMECSGTGSKREECVMPSTKVINMTLETETEELCRSNHPSIVAIVEPRISGVKADHVIHRLPFSNSHRVEARGFAGGIWLLWEESRVQISILFNHPQLIHTRVTYQNDSFLFTAIYGSPQECWRKYLWSNLEALAASINEPWVLGGDFNSVLSGVERRNNFGRQGVANKLFVNCLSNTNLLDLGFTGCKFTWKSGSKKARLDRFVCNTAWRVKNPEVTVFHLARTGSDHNPLLLRAGAPPSSL